MFSDPVFRTALLISFFAHMTIMAPWPVFKIQKDAPENNAVEITYIVIEDAQLTQDKEQYVESKDIEEIKDALVTDSEAKKTAYLKYFNLIREKIRARLHASFDGARKGTARAVFTVSPSGRLLKVDEVTSSAAPLIKQRTIRGIEKAGPFPVFPPELGNKPVTFSLTIQFTPK